MLCACARRVGGDPHRDLRRGRRDAARAVGAIDRPIITLSSASVESDESTALAVESMSSLPRFIQAS
jgi:hypothetical protein